MLVVSSLGVLSTPIDLQPLVIAGPALDAEPRRLWRQLQLGYSSDQSYVWVTAANEREGPVPPIFSLTPAIIGPERA